MIILWAKFILHEGMTKQPVFCPLKIKYEYILRYVFNYYAEISELDYATVAYNTSINSKMIYYVWNIESTSFHTVYPGNAMNDEG